MAHGERVPSAMTAPNVPMADLRLNIAVHRVTSERFMIISFG